VYEARTHGSVRGMMLDLIIQHHPTRFLKGLRHYWQRKSLPTHFFAYLDLLHYYINYVLLFIYHKIVVYQFLRFSAMRRMRFPYRSHITIRERYGSHIGVLLEKFRDLFGNNLYSIYRWLAEY